MKYQAILLSIIVMSMSSCKSENPSTNETYSFLIGTYTQKEGHVDGKANGVYKVSISPSDMTFDLQDSIVGLVNPSYLDINATNSRAVIANEVGSGYPSGWLSLVDLSKPNFGKILDTMSSGAFAPCHLVIDNKSKVIFTNYVGGVIGEASIKGDRFDNLIYSRLDDETESTNTRQESSHPHSTVTTADGQFTYIADLGTDKVWIINNEADLKEGYELDYFLMPYGSGPRHMTMTEDGNYLYVINELNNTIATLMRDERNGSLTMKGDLVKSCPADYIDRNSGADMHISNDGKYLYISNRGHNSIGIFILSPTPKLLGYEPTNGATPRNFTLTKDGRYLIAANQDSNNLSIFAIKADGMLDFVFSLPMLTPVCLVEL